MTESHLPDLLKASPFRGRLFPEQASRAIKAAIDCACEHLETAELLYEHKRFAHCVSTSILAIEEAGKMPLIMDIFLSGESADRWREYSSHPAKTRHLNQGITMRVKIAFPDAPPGFAEQIGQAGPPPEILEKAKQRAVYSDCLVIRGKCHVHDPATVQWEEVAKYVLDDARVFVKSLRPKTPTELTIWLKHAQTCRSEGRSFDTELVALERSLRDAGFIKEGQWKVILAEAGQV